MTDGNYNSEQIIEEILRGGDTALRKMYPRYQKSFLAWARAWNRELDSDTLIEAYMEAIKIFYINVASGRLTELKSSVDNYLIGIGKHYLIKKVNFNKKIVPPDNLEQTLPDDDNFLIRTIEEELDDEYKTKLKIAFSQLGEQCQKLLTLAFFDNKKSADIKQIMNFENENTVYASKARCIVQLRKLMLKLK